MGCVRSGVNLTVLEEREGTAQSVMKVHLAKHHVDVAEQHEAKDEGTHDVNPKHDAAELGSKVARPHRPPGQWLLPV